MANDFGSSGRKAHPLSQIKTELIWEGKYDVQGRQVAPLRVALPFQTVETVNESAQDRQRQCGAIRDGKIFCRSTASTGIDRAGTAAFTFRPTTFRDNPISLVEADAGGGQVRIQSGPLSEQIREEFRDIPAKC
jgi:hypothetical protein